MTDLDHPSDNAHILGLQFAYLALAKTLVESAAIDLDTLLNSLGRAHDRLDKRGEVDAAATILALCQALAEY